jgi:hypothetical protein
MPILPLDHPEPFAATLGVMLYPATDEADPPKARAFASQFLAEPIRRFHEAGHTLTHDALQCIAMDAGQRLTISKTAGQAADQDVDLSCCWMSRRDRGSFDRWDRRFASC